MNERIAKLANESGFDVDKTGAFGNYSEMVRVQKFVQLIVQECINTIDPNVGEKWFKDMSEEEFWKSQSIHIIKQHFGVEK
jgi:hypothetical protein